MAGVVGQIGIGISEVSVCLLPLSHDDGTEKNRPARADWETGKRHTMNVLLWVLQALAALVYGSSGVMKVFMFEKVSQDVPSFGAMPRKAADNPGCHGSRGREPRVRVGAHQVQRGRAHDFERRAGPPHGVHRVWADGSASDLVNCVLAPIESWGDSRQNCLHDMRIVGNA